MRGLSRIELGESTLGTFVVVGMREIDAYTNAVVFASRIWKNLEWDGANIEGAGCGGVN